MTLIAAAVVERRHDPMYQLATSVTNPCDMRRSIELTSLAHASTIAPRRAWSTGYACVSTPFRSRNRGITACRRRRRRRSIKSIQRIMSPLPLKRPPLVKAERSLEKVEKLIELFEPFILHNEHDFVAENVEKLSQALVSEECGSFGYDTRSIDWWDYWINVHIPALRRWTYPLIEGRPLEARPPRTFQLAPETDGDTVKTGTNGATWRYS